MRDVVKAMITAVVLALTILIFSEISLRVLFPQKPIKLRSIRFKENLPNVSEKLFITSKQQQEYLHKKTVDIRIDENGFVEPSIVHGDPDVTILFLGGSTTLCAFVEEENRFAYLAGRLIEDKTGLRINAINSGVPQNNSFHSLDKFLNHDLRFKPDIAVLHHCINDVMLLTFAKSYWNTQRKFSLIIENQSFSLRGLAMHIRFKLLRSTLDAILRHPYVKAAVMPMLDRASDDFMYLRGTKISLDPEHVCNEFRMNLETFIAIAQARNVKPVLMTQANRLKHEPDQSVLLELRKLQDHYGISYEDFKELIDASNEMIRSVGAEYNLLVIDLDKTIPKSSEMMYDLVHYTDEGSRTAAYIISEHLLSLARKLP